MIDVLKALCDLPRPSRNRESIVEDLCAGRSVVWALPETVDAEHLVGSVLDSCAWRSVRLQTVQADAADGNPEAVLIDALGPRVDGQQDVCVRDLFAADGMPDLVLLAGFDEISPDIVPVWLRLVTEWSEAAKWYAAETGVSRALFIPIQDARLAQTIRGDVFLAVHWYWGWLSTQEMALVAASVSEERNLSYEVRMWIQSVGAELAGTDPELLCHLIYESEEDDFRGFEASDVIRTMVRFAERRGWTQEWLWEQARALGGDDALACTPWIQPGSAFVSGSPAVSSSRPTCSDRSLWFTSVSGSGATCRERPTSPPASLLPLWQAGVIDWQPDEGLFIHSAALAALNDTTTLRHRMWMGQAKLLLPLIDARRLEICRYLETAFHDWVAFCADSGCVGSGSFGVRCNEAGDSSYSDSVSLLNQQEPVAEFSEILRFLKTRRALDYGGLYCDVDVLRRARNALAHYTPLTWQAFCETLKTAPGARGGTVGWCS